MTTAQSKIYPLANISVNPDRQRKDLGDLSELMRSLSEVGQLQDIIITEEGVLIAGERRYTAMTELGWDQCSVKVFEELSELERHRIELDENVQRLDLTWQERTMAIYEYHKLSSQLHKDWTVEHLGTQFNIGERQAQNYISVGKALEAGDNALVVNAERFSKAFNILKRSSQRAAASEDEELNTLISGGSVQFPPEATGVSSDDVADEEEELTPTSSAPVAPIICENFIDWYSDYTGPKFNLLHCDFPYGINADDHGLGAADSMGDYDDSEEVYFTLLAHLEVACKSIVAESAHMIFWFSMNHYHKTKTILEQMGWYVNPHPINWHKTDNRGISPRPDHDPRQILETAFFCTRGDRPLVRMKANTIGAPTTKEVHMSEKTRPMLEHFFEMVVDEHTVMLDPTCGSGNAVTVAHNLGAKSVLGIEIDEQFHEMACEQFIKHTEME